MNIAGTDNFRTVFNTRNCGQRPALSGAVVLFLVLNTVSLAAGQSFFWHKGSSQPATNAPPGSPATLLEASTNVSQAGVTNSMFALGIPQPATNAPLGSPATLSQASTNVSQAGVTNSMFALDDTHTLSIGDRLSFRIVEDEEQPQSLIVTDSGDLEVPYIGRFPAENRTCKQLARELKAALEKEYYYQATVIIAVDSMTRSRGKVYLVGAVRMPGPQELPSDEVLTLSKAILRAGGFTDSADTHKVKITRPGSTGETNKVTLVVDVGQIFNNGKTEKDVTLKPGDLIYTPERLIRF
jgi:protein involved in polysaccharide export with SLBB domain